MFLFLFLKLFLIEHYHPPHSPLSILCLSDHIPDFRITLTVWHSELITPLQLISDQPIFQSTWYHLPQSTYFIPINVYSGLSSLLFMCAVVFFLTLISWTLYQLTRMGIRRWESIMYNSIQSSKRWMLFSDACYSGIR